MKKDKDNNNYEILKDGTLTSVPGFFTGSTNCGLKGSGKRDIVKVFNFPVIILKTCNNFFCGNDAL